MGTARLLLALSVVFAHAAAVRGFGGVGGQLAVEMFFVVSGFYMALVLDQKYAPTSSGRRSFWLNRFLRLAPCYYAILVATLLLSRTASWVDASPATFPAALSTWRHYGAGLGWPARLLLGLTNVTILGQEIPQFLAVNPASGELVTAFHGTPAGCIPGWQFCVIPQAWTLSLEFTFYLLAPWLVRRSNRTLGLMIGASVLVRVATFFAFGQHDPWTYRFFPSELGMFLAGILAYRWYRQLTDDRRVPLDRIARAVALGTLALLLVYERLGALALVAAFAAAVPWLFLASRRHRVDRWIGELSYPVYLVHVMLLPFARQLSASIPAIPVGLIDAVLSVLFAAGFWALVERPVDRFRQERALQTRLANA